MHVSGVDCITVSCKIVACDGGMSYVLKDSKQDPTPFDHTLFIFHLHHYSQSYSKGSSKIVI